MSGEFEGYMSLVPKHEAKDPEFTAWVEEHKQHLLAQVDLPTLASAYYEAEERLQQLEVQLHGMAVLTKVMLHTLEAVSGIANHALAKADTMEPWLSPVFWICPSPHCGAPQEVPGIVWWMMQTKLLPCKCQVCTWYAVFEEVAHYGNQSGQS